MSKFLRFEISIETGKGACRFDSPVILVFLNGRSGVGSGRRVRVRRYVEVLIIVQRGLHIMEGLYY